MKFPYKPMLAGVCVAVALLAAEEARGQAEPMWPDTEYAASVPSMEDIFGHAVGERILSPRAINGYLRVLAGSAGDRIWVARYARSWEGRDLVYAAIGSEENMGRLEEIREGMQRLADPREISGDEADRLIADLPVGVWLTYGVHGNEISSPDAALYTAYHLLAAQNDPIVDEILTKAIVFIVALQNPDGRNRFVHDYETALGLEPDASPLAAEHNEPWPGGRTNHYHFDMNRDWFALTQPEIRGQAQAILQWYPQVVIDLHEMGSTSTYYFAPPAKPVNPFLTETQRAGWELIGRNNARWFDRFGFDYFTREVYDAFYPGYGDSWPAYHGAVAATYEQASPRGLVMRQPDGGTLTFREAVRHHFVASIATAQAAAENRQQLLRDFYEYRRSAIEEGESEAVHEYILPLEGDPSAVHKLAGLLAMQGIEVLRAEGPIRSGSETYPPGTYVVRMNQPASRLARNLLDAHVPMDEEFLEEQERRRRKDLPDEIYDVTTWSLPLTFNVTCLARPERSRGDFEPVAPQWIRPGRVVGEVPAEVAYLVPWGSRAAGRFLTAALRADVQVWSSDKGFRQGEREYPRGTLIVKVDENGGDLEAVMRRLAGETGAEVVGTNTGWVDEGVNFGSRHVHKIEAPRIALAWDRPTSAYSAGAARYVLERQFGYPVTVVRTRDLAGADLAFFDVLILPDSNGYEDELGESAESLRQWVDAGGTLIGIGDATAFLASEEGGLLDMDQEYAAKEKKEKTSEKDEEEKDRVAGKVIKKRDGYLEVIEPEEELPDAVAGVLLRAETDPDHWLTAGVAERLNVLVNGRAIFTPITLDEGVNAAHFAGPEDVLASGYLWEANRKQYAFKPFAVVQPRDRGFVIAFTADPNFRAYMDGLNVLFLNAVFRGPAHARPAY